VCRIQKLPNFQLSFGILLLIWASIYYDFNAKKCRSKNGIGLSHFMQCTVTATQINYRAPTDFSLFRFVVPAIILCLGFMAIKEQLHFHRNNSDFTVWCFKQISKHMHLLYTVPSRLHLQVLCVVLLIHTWTHSHQCW